MDAVYMSVCQALTGSGGWPLTVLMTPDQKPFFAGTYFPKKSRYGQPGLIDLLGQIAYLWKNDRKQLLQAGEQIAAAIAQERPSDGREPDKELLHRGYRLFRRRFDAAWGGFGPAPKFPAPHNLLFLMQYAQWEGEPDAFAMAEATLEAMDRGGIHDQFGGGFSRYSTDETWLIPHFEKMLYDNALLLMAYVYAYQTTRKESYADTARRTADYILRELAGESGGFSAGRMPTATAWRGNITCSPPRKSAGFWGRRMARKSAAGMGSLNRAILKERASQTGIGQTASPLPRDDSRLQQLRAYRQNRTLLHTDDKILLSWNAWTVIALARAGRALAD